MTEFSKVFENPTQGVNKDWDAYDARNRVETAVREGAVRHRETGQYGGSVPPENAAIGNRISAHELLRSVAGQIEKQARGMRELADILQASEMLRGNRTSDRVWELVSTIVKRPV